MLDSKTPADSPPLLELRSVARQLEFSEEFAIGIYLRELDGLRQQAKLDRFVAILAEKRAKHALRRLRLQPA